MLSFSREACESQRNPRGPADLRANHGAYMCNTTSNLEIVISENSIAYLTIVSPHPISISIYSHTLISSNHTKSFTNS